MQPDPIALTSGPRAPEVFDRRHLLRYLGRLVLYAGLLFFLLQADVYARRNGLIRMRPILLLVAFLIPTVLFTLARVRPRPGAPGLMQVMAANGAILVPFGLLSALSLVTAILPAANWGQTPGRLETRLLLLTTVDFCLLLAFGVVAMIPAVHRHFRTLCKVGIVLLVLTIGLDTVAPGTFSKMISRAAGFGENPNNGAIQLLVLTAAALTYERFRRSDLLVLAIAGLGIFSTLSRGGILIYAILAALYLGIVTLAQWRAGRRPHRRMLRMAGAMALVALLAGSFGAWLVQSSPMFDTYVGKRRLAMLTGQKKLVEEDSRRFDLVRSSWALIAQRPFTGHGTGHVFALEQGPHNQYLRMWIDHGVLGPLLYLALLAGAVWSFFWRRYPPGLALIVVLALSGLFDHNVLDDRTNLALLAILAVASLQPQAVGRWEPEAAEAA